MSGALPTSPSFADITITSIVPTLQTKSIAGNRQVRQIGGQYFKLYASYPPMTRSQFAPIYGFIMKQRGSFETFTVIPPIVGSTTGTSLGTPLVKGASQTGRSIATDGWTADQSAGSLLKAGDYIKFANHTKIYNIVTDNSSDSGGNSTLTIEPALITSPADNGAITTGSVPFTVYLMSGGVVEYSVGLDNTFSFALDLCEAF
jgi:hypothetical protein